MTGTRSVVDQIGQTPLLRLYDEELPRNVNLFAKLEFFNPGGSVKDRPALRMIRDGERNGELVPGKVILDSTSGNTGIAYAMIGAALGYPVPACDAGECFPGAKGHPLGIRCRCRSDRPG